MKKKAITSIIGATFVGLLIGSTFGVSMVNGMQYSDTDHSGMDHSAGMGNGMQHSGDMGKSMQHSGDMGKSMQHSAGMGKDMQHSGGVAKGADELAKVLKLTTEELKTQLMSGKTLAEVAKAQKVDVARVIDAIVAKAKTHIAEAVTAGKLTQAQANTKLAELRTKATEMVNSVPPAHGKNSGHGKNSSKGRSSHTHNEG